MTRMWGVDPRHLCNQHLLGEHKEVHQLLGHIRAGNLACVRGHAERGQIDTSRIESRHEALADEMAIRGMTHDSPLEYDDDLELGDLDIEANRRDLAERCDDCAARLKAQVGPADSDYADTGEGGESK